jgi:predicted AAA+ superfamily ATPase
MALTNQERVGKAVELLRDGLKTFVERELAAVHGPKWGEVADLGQERGRRGSDPLADPHVLLNAIWLNWEQVFKRKLSQTERTLVSELRDIRNRWAHHEAFTTDDAYRALDSAERLLKAVSAPQAAEVERQRKEVMRLRYEDDAKREILKAGAAPVEGQPQAGLKAWRDVVTPHADVASGRYQQAEFAADLAQVQRGEGSDEYRNPKDFFRRTYVTEGIRRLLVGALQRLSGAGGDPVVELQTTFGGGKTHSMLALYHLFSGAAIADLPGVEPILKEAGVALSPKARRAVFVGTAPSVADARKMPDGTRIHTMWGDLAWQLGEKKGYAIVAEADKRGVSPGSDALRQVLSMAAPCLILIDEWVAYVRLLYGVDGLPGGSFDSNLTFAQSLTEAARAVDKALVVATLPQSNIEVGGEGGAQALTRLEHTFRRTGAAWAPASAEESFEIVRRRLFEPIETAKAPLRDAVIKAFSMYYSDNKQEFPPGCGEGDYERRLRDAYPVHPELFERLYGDWSTLDRFQRTRGVLRLMAEIIQALWERQDASLLIMPAHVPLDLAPVQNELTRYLPPPWPPVIDREVDGPNSLPLAIDREQPSTLGRYSAARRVARTVFLGSAPHSGVAHQGLDDRRIRLGCAQPGETVATFGDALRRLSDRAVHLFQDGARYWYSLQQNVTRTAQDRAAQQRREDVFEEIRRRLRDASVDRGDFDRVHACPSSPSDVSDEPEARLVLVDPEQPHIKDQWASTAAALAAEVLESRGASPRRNRNALVFLAADKARLEAVESAARLYLAWHSMERDKDALNLDPFQLSQVKTKVKESDDTVRVRLPEAYVWLLIPEQERRKNENGEPTQEVDPQGKVVWQNERLQSGPEALAVRASRKLKGAESLLTSMGATRLRMELDRIPLWRGEHVSLRQLTEDFGRYLYLPRLRSPAVLREAVEAGLNLTTWDRESFAYADGWDESLGRYRALRVQQLVRIDLDGEGLLVKPEAAVRQMAAEAAARAPVEGSTAPPEEGEPGMRAAPGVAIPPEEPRPLVLRRFHGSVELDPARTGRDAGRIAEEVVQHLTTLKGATVGVTLEIRAEASGIPDNVVRTVTENCRTLKFTNHGFEEE